MRAQIAAPALQPSRPATTPVVAPALVSWTRWLALCTACIFLGRGYQYWFFDSPLWSLLWDESLLADGLTALTGRTWSDYVADPAVGRAIFLAVRLSGATLVLGAIAVLWRLWADFRRTPDREATPYQEAGFGKLANRVGVALVAAGWFVCALYVLLDTREHFGQVAHLLEHAIQLGVPLILLAIWTGLLQTAPSVSFAAKAITAITFAAHGLYAAGIYPLPGNFVDMTIMTLGVSETVATRLLLSVGILDLVAAIAVFVPAVRRVAYVYMIAWGLATAAARIWAGLNAEAIVDSLHQTGYLTLYRLPHGLLPLALLLLDTRAFPRYTSHVQHLHHSRIQEA